MNLGEGDPCIAVVQPGALRVLNAVCWDCPWVLFEILFRGQCESLLIGGIQIGVSPLVVSLGSPRQMTAFKLLYRRKKLVFLALSHPVGPQNSNRSALIHLASVSLDVILLCFLERSECVPVRLWP